MDEEKVMSWLEGLVANDWRDFHSDNEVSEIANIASKTFGGDSGSGGFASMNLQNNTATGISCDSGTQSRIAIPYRDAIWLLARQNF